MGAPPWMKFYPSDWQSDVLLRACSIAARGLWVEMLCIMQKAEPIGHLLVNGKKPSTALLAVLCGVSERELKRLLAELEGYNVFDVQDGVIVSRRMVRDAAKALKDKENGKKGGNPQITLGVNPDLDRDDKAQSLRDQSPEERKGTVVPQTGEPVPGSDLPLSDSMKAGRSTLRPHEWTDGDLRWAFTAWDAMASRVGLKPAGELSDRRKRLLRARLTDVGGVDGWLEALRRIESSRLLRGEKTDFKATIEFPLRPDKLRKIMDGEYDDHQKPAAPRRLSIGERIRQNGAAGADRRPAGANGADRVERPTEISARPEADGGRAGNRYQAAGWDGPELEHGGDG